MGTTPIDTATNRWAGRPRPRSRPSISPLSCPRCGLVLAVRPPWIDPEYCPRCLAFAHASVKLVARSPGTPVP